MNEYTVLHLFSGIGGAALGFQGAVEEYRGMVGRFRTLVGIDCDPEACADFETLVGAPAVQMDLFSWNDYTAFHGQEPPEGWQEANSDDLREAAGRECPDVVFLSPPCKGFSGLLPSKSAASNKYQALNRLVIRGLKLTLEAFSDDLPAVIMLENVPRITSRGEFLLKQVKHLLAGHGYLFHEGYHDCGEIGSLGQRRKRYLLIARLQEKMSAFIYRPEKRRVKSVGEIIGPLSMPDDPACGP
ncbi:MAG: DNA cytosine methyltransferase, partial [Desulfotomaculaceae bacterium]|nr:DNA cytosine methyltransferase [Desulfotomaculaceae bacterium]